MGQDEPGDHRVRRRAQPAQRLGGEVARLHARRGDIVDQHVFTRGINNFTQGENRRRNPPVKQVLAGKHKPAQPEDEKERRGSH